MNKFVEYLRDVRIEMGKVSWPTRNEVASATTLVVILSVVFAIVVKIYDVFLSKVLGMLLNI